MPHMAQHYKTFAIQMLDIEGLCQACQQIGKKQPMASSPLVGVTAGQSGRIGSPTKRGATKR